MALTQGVKIDLAERLRTLFDVGEGAEQHPPVSLFRRISHGSDQLRSADQALLHRGGQEPAGWTGRRECAGSY